MTEKLPTIKDYLQDDEWERLNIEICPHEWISVKGKLPDKKGYYLCSYIHDNHRFYIDRWFDGHDFCTIETITHWMVLPEVAND